MTIKPYLIVPNLIIQPTWGGKYICEHKGITHEAIANENIGQAYELYEDSNLTESSGKPFEVGQPENPPQVTKYDGDSFSINELISKNPEAVLGKKALDKHGSKVQILIKFTQAKGNSYQIHVRKPTGKWLTKPESWYYLEPGTLTLGVKPGINWANYESACRQIDDLGKNLSSKVKTGKVTLAEAKAQWQALIEKLNPEQYVNAVSVKAEEAIDLSACGIHHSWEEDDKIAPLGNILYEVQRNVYDPVSTIRCFDKGKMKDDGSIRELQIDEYFQNIDRSLETNNPENHSIKVVDGKVFKSDHYSMDEIKITGPLKLKTGQSYEHIFVKEGKVELTAGETKLSINQGFGAFVPAATGEYWLNSLNSKAVVFKTYL